MKNLVMSAATGYDWYALEPFVTSWRKNCPDTELVLFVDNISDFTVDKLKRGGVYPIAIPDEYKKVLIIHSRWKMYLDFLEQFGNDFAQVFVADIRDVIFQGDVFAPFKNRAKWLGYTTEAKNIGTAGRNYKWLAGFYGKAEADKFVDKKIICCGTVIGSVAEMKIFCRKMWDTLKTQTVWGYEQAAMNYFVRNKLLPIENLIEIDTFSGEIFTNGFVKDNKVRGDKILRGDDGVPAVVHQYDRHRELVKLVDETYRDKNFSADERFNDPRSILEQVIHLLRIDKLDDAARFFTAKIFDGANFNGNIDTLLKIWHHALNEPLSPAVGYLELSAQNALLTVHTWSSENIRNACALLNLAKKNNRAVSRQAKDFVAETLRRFAEQAIDKSAAELCFVCLDLIQSLDVPLDKNFYLLAAKANRIFRRKDAALAAYKKFLDLS